MEGIAWRVLQPLTIGNKGKGISTFIISFTSGPPKDIEIPLILHIIIIKTSPASHKKIKDYIIEAGPPRCTRLIRRECDVVPPVVSISLLSVSFFVGWWCGGTTGEKRYDDIILHLESFFFGWGSVHLIYLSVFFVGWTDLSLKGMIVVPRIRELYHETEVGTLESFPITSRPDRKDRRKVITSLIPTCNLIPWNRNDPVGEEEGDNRLGSQSYGPTCEM